MKKTLLIGAIAVLATSTVAWANDTASITAGQKAMVAVKAKPSSAPVAIHSAKPAHVVHASSAAKAVKPASAAK